MSEPFDQGAFPPHIKPSTEALNRAMAAERRALSFFYERLHQSRINTGTDVGQLKTGFIGEGFKVRPVSPATMQITVTAGLGFYYDNTIPLPIATDINGLRYQGISDVSPYRPLVLGSTVTITVPAAPPMGQSRYDIVEVRPKRDLDDYGPDLRYQAAVSDFRPDTNAAALRYGSTQAEAGLVTTPTPSTQPVSFVKGVAAATGSQVEPPTTPGYVQIARILVNAGDISVDAGAICNRRALVFPESGMGRVSGRATIRSQRLAKIRPALTHLVAPPGVQVVIFDRDTVPAMTGFPISPNIMLMTGAPLTFFDGGCQLVNPVASMTPLTDNERPIIAHGCSVAMNRFLQVADIDAPELLSANTTAPAGQYAEGEYFSSLRPYFCGWSGTDWTLDMSTQDPIEFSFWMDFMY